MHMRAGGTIIDCDVHARVPAVSALLPYLSAFWRETIEQTGFKGPVDDPYPANVPAFARDDDGSADGDPPRSDLDLLRTEVLDTWGAEYAIVNCAYAVDSLHNPDAASAFASAVNDWLVAEWLEPEPRLRASLVVPIQYPELAAREIERVGSHPGFVQVFLPARAPVPYGNRRYHPIYEATVRHNLVVGVQFGGAPGVPPSASGWPSYYLEEYVGMTSVFQSQLMSLVSEGVFDQFPDLRVAMVEGGFTWLPSLMWRFDKEWKGLRREVPWVKRPPSEYIREHVRFTVQPVDAPPNPRHLVQIIEQIGSDDLLMFSTDYPHRHFDRLDDAFPVELSAARMRKIMADNARAFYRL